MNATAIALLFGLFLADTQEKPLAPAPPAVKKPAPAKLPRKRPATAPVAADDAKAHKEGDGHDHAPALQPKAKPAQTAEDLDRQLRDLIEKARKPQGGDAEDSEAQHPLARIGRQMRDSESRIVQKDTGEETQKLQQRIVADLDALLDRLNQQASTCPKCGGAGCKECQQLGKKPSQAQGQAQGQKPSNSGKPGNNQQANQAAAQAGKTTPQKAQLAARITLVKDVWGHLPPRMRDKLEQMADDVFLPQYELLIEQYYQALLEQEREKPANSR